MTPIDLACVMYEQERQDERAFFSSTAGLLVGGLSVVAAVVGAVGTNHWQFFVIGPGLTASLYAYFAHQTVIGARRRVYMAALERFLQEESGAGMLRLPTSASIVPLAGFSQYSWTANTFEKFATWPSKILFASVNAYPLALALTVPTVSVIRLANGSHSKWLWAVGIIIGTQLIVILCQGKLLRCQDDAAWRRPSPTSFAA
jgi:hypothetical protein